MVWLRHAGAQRPAGSVRALAGAMPGTLTRAGWRAPGDRRARLGERRRERGLVELVHPNRIGPDDLPLGRGGDLGMRPEGCQRLLELMLGLVRIVRGAEEPVLAQGPNGGGKPLLV